MIKIFFLNHPYYGRKTFLLLLLYLRRYLPSACTVFLHQPGKVVCVEVLQPLHALPHTDQAARCEVLQVWQVALAKALVLALLEPAMAQAGVLAPPLTLVMV